MNARMLWRWAKLIHKKALHDGGTEPIEQLSDPKAVISKFTKLILDIDGLRRTHNVRKAYELMTYGNGSRPYDRWWDATKPMSMAIHQLGELCSWLAGNLPSDCRNGFQGLLRQSTTPLHILNGLTCIANYWADLYVTEQGLTVFTSREINLGRANYGPIVTKLSPEAWSCSTFQPRVSSTYTLPAASGHDLLVHHPHMSGTGFCLGHELSGCNRLWMQREFEPVLMMYHNCLHSYSPGASYFNQHGLFGDPILQGLACSFCGRTNRGQHDIRECPSCHRPTCTYCYASVACSRCLCQNCGYAVATIRCPRPTCGAYKRCVRCHKKGLTLCPCGLELVRPDDVQPINKEQEDVAQKVSKRSRIRKSRTATATGTAIEGVLGQVLAAEPV